MSGDPAEAYRIARGLVMTVQANGRVAVWRPRSPGPYVVDADLLGFALAFGDGATRAAAAESASLEDDDSLEEILGVLLAEGVLTRVGVDRDEAIAAELRGAARVRIDELVDAGTFVEHATGPVIVGVATIDGHRVAVAGWEPMSLGGIEEVIQLQELALKERLPIVYLFDLFSIGRDFEREFVGARSVGRIYANMARLDGVVPQLGIVYGSLFRPAAFPPGLCDVLILLEGQAFVHVGDPKLVTQFTGVTVSAEELGGAAMHAEVSGLADRVVATSQEAAVLVRRCVSILSGHPGAVPPSSGAPPARSLHGLVPDQIDRPFDILPLVRGTIDEGSLLELKPAWAPELVTAFARLDGLPVGIVANQSNHKGGVLTVEACDKAARFISLCDAYGVPLLFLADVPGFAIGRAAERGGIVRAAARLFQAIGHATVPRITLIVRRANTAGLYAMCGPPFDPDAFLALPSASISIFSERGLLPPGVERTLDGDTRQTIGHVLRAQRTPASRHAEVVPLDRVRAELAGRLRRLFGSRRITTAAASDPSSARDPS